MAVNQPKIGKDQADNSWKLEVTTQANNEEARVNDLASRLAALEAGLGVNNSGGDGNNTPGFSLLALQQNDYMVRIINASEASYQFTMVNGDIPETHMLFLGGMRLCESTTTTPRDYSISGNTVTLTRTSNDFQGLDLVLTIFTLA